MFMKFHTHALVLATLLSPALALAQVGAGTPGAGGPGGAGAGGVGGVGGVAGGPGGARGGAFDPASFQAQQLQLRIDQFKTQLAPANDEEWKIVSEKIAAIMTLQAQIAAGRTTNTRGMGGMGGGRGGGGGTFGQPADPSNPVAVAAAALATTTQDTTSPVDALKTRLAALREARKKLQDDLLKAQVDLKALVTVRQEAILVNAGILE
jgi:hypothetical protein